MVLVKCKQQFQSENCTSPMNTNRRACANSTHPDKTAPVANSAGPDQTAPVGAV